MRREEIIWVDSEAPIEGGWRDVPDKLKPKAITTIRTIGYVGSESKVLVRLLFSYDKANQATNYYMDIPKVAIVKRRKLKH